MIRYGLVRFPEDTGFSEPSSKKFRADISLAMQVDSISRNIREAPPETVPEPVVADPEPPNILDAPPSATPGEIIYNLEASTAPPTTTPSVIPPTSFEDIEIAPIDLANELSWDVPETPPIPLQTVITLVQQNSEILPAGLLSAISALNATLQWMTKIASLGKHPVSDVLVQISSTAKAYLATVKDLASKMKAAGVLSDDLAKAVTRLDDLVRQGDDIIAFVRGYEDDLIDMVTDWQINTAVKEGAESVNAAIANRLPRNILTSSIDDTSKGMGKSLVYFGYENIDEIRAALAKRATDAATKQAEELAVKEAADKLAQETAEKLAQETTQKLAQEAEALRIAQKQAEEAARLLQQQADEEAARILKQQADDAAELLVKQAEEAARRAQQALDDLAAAQLAQQQADEAAQAAAELALKEAEDAAALLQKEADEAAEAAARLLQQQADEAAELLAKQQADEAAALLVKQQADDALKSNIQQVINALKGREEMLKTNLDTLVNKVDNAIRSGAPIPQSLFDDVYKFGQQPGLNAEQLRNLDNMSTMLNQADDIAKLGGETLMDNADNVLLNQLDDVAEEAAQRLAQEASEAIAQRASQVSLMTLSNRLTSQLSADALEQGFRRLSSTTVSILTQSLSKKLGTVFAEAAFKRTTCMLV